MYLSASKYVGNWDHSNKEETEAYKKISKAIGLNGFTCEGSPSMTIDVTVAYWRKANSIHQWFVDNCAKGVDECQPIYVSRKDLEDLRDLVKDVLIHRNKASVALPTASGFFFGSTEYDEWYWSDLEYTVKELDRVLIQTFGDEGVSFIYQASW